MISLGFFATTVAVLSTLSVTVEPTQTLSAPRGAQHVQMMQLELSADCATDIPLEELHLLRRGLGLHSDIAGVYAEADGLRVSTTATVARDGSVDLRFSRFFVPACGRAVVTVFMDLTPVADIAGEHRLELQSGGQIVAPGATVRIILGMTVPRTATVRTAGDTVGTLSIDYLRLLKPVRYGEDRVVMRMKLSADGRSDHRIERITVTNAGSARDDNLQNLAFKDTRGKRVSRVTGSMTGKKAVMVFDPPLWIQRGSTRTIELRAAVRSGVRRTIHFVIEEPGDVVSREIRGRNPF